jgi:PAS domain S-box-containing protein
MPVDSRYPRLRGAPAPRDGHRDGRHPLLHLDGRMVDANAASERMSGYAADERRGVTDWALLTPPEFMAITGERAADLSDCGVTVPCEKRRIRKDGSRWWGLFAPTRLAGSGRNSECVEFVVDITESKRIEDSLHASDERKAFLLRLSDALRPLGDPVQVQAAAACVLGEHLRASRVAYYELAEPD